MPEVERDVRCPTGEARITPPFDLPCSAIIHAVGPVFDSRNPQQSRDQLKQWLALTWTRVYFDAYKLQSLPVNEANIASTRLKSYFPKFVDSLSRQLPEQPASCSREWALSRGFPRHKLRNLRISFRRCCRREMFTNMVLVKWRSDDD